MNLSLPALREFENWLPVIAGLAFFLFIVDLGLLANKKKIQTLKNLLVYFNGKISKGSLFLPTFNGEYLGLPFLIRLFPEGKNTPPYLHISFKKSASWVLRIFKETSLSEIGKKLRLVREVEIHDPAFDKEFLILSTNPAQATHFLSDERVRSVIKDFFNLGFMSLNLDKNQLVVAKGNYKLEQDLEPLRVKDLVEKLAFLVQRII